MGHITSTPSGNWRANWRDPSGRQKAKTFRTKREASRFLAEVESSMSRGLYIDPHAGRTRFAEFAGRWERSRVVEQTTAASTRSKLRSRLLPYWGSWPLGKIDHMAVQEWVNKLARDLEPSSVASYHATLSAIMSAAVRGRLIAANPCEGVQLPAQRANTGARRTISQQDLEHKLLPVVPEHYRALPATAAGAGLRWGECLGLRWADIDLDRGLLTVHRVMIEVRGRVMVKLYPKSKAGHRVVPLAPFLVDALKQHRDKVPGRGDPNVPVFTGPYGGALSRGSFRRRTWRPALVRAGFLGGVVMLGDKKFRALWTDESGIEHGSDFTTETKAVSHVAAKASGGLKFHDLPRCYATWLVSAGLPVNVVQKVMGHEQATTTLNLYTEGPADYYDAIRTALAGQTRHPC